MAIQPRVEKFDSPLWYGAVDDDPIRRLLNQRVPWITHGSTFSSQSIGTGPWRDQGWKLHVSATPPCAVDVLRAALDVLLAGGARFKVVNTMRQLAAMNSGLYASSQIGKFITVYPSDDAQAVHLAIELDRATSGQRGPRVPTDRPLHPGSVVHYRYGSMRGLPESGGIGQDLYDLLDPVGRLTNDLRFGFYCAPHPDISDPFEAAGVRVPSPPRSQLLQARYLVADALAQSSRGGVFRAIDIGAQPARLCLVKESWHDVALDPYGRDARDWALNEEAILTRYDGDPALPRCFDSFELDGDCYLVLEYLEGTTVETALFERESIEDRIDTTEVIALGLATADILAHLHEIGLVFRDFKPGNIVRTPDGHYRLIDFGIAYQYRLDDGPPLSIGTPPYYPREQYELQRPCPADDVFAWGAVLHYLLAGQASLADMPKGDDFLLPFRRRPLAELSEVPPELAEVVDRAVAWDREDRYAIMREAESALADASRRLQGRIARGSTPGRSSRRPEETGLQKLGPEEALRLAREVGDALCGEAEEHTGGVRWKRRFEFNDEVEYSPDIYGGTAGVGLFLAELAQATGEERYAASARAAARWVGGAVWGRGRAQHGLHCGEAGLAYFFARLARLLDEPGYLDAAAMRLRRLRGAECHTLDLMYGTAGTLLGSVYLHSVTGASEFLDDACQIADRLASAGLPAPNGRSGCYWEIPSAPGGPVVPYLGLLHGAAGLGLALAHVAQVTGEERYLDIAVSAAELLLEEATPAPDSVPSPGRATDDTALTWPRHLGDTGQGVQAHCHGAGGIGQFFLLLHRLRPDPRYLSTAKGAAKAILDRSARETRSGVCHGLSGAGHFFLDLYQACQDPQWLSFAEGCRDRLRACRVPERPGVYTMDGKNAVSADLMIGYAGIGSFHLRLADPAQAPDLILGRLVTLRKG